MEKRNLGKIEVSKIGMGTMAFSYGYGKIPERQYSIDAIRAAFEYGCTFFDTAEAYGAQLYYDEEFAALETALEGCKVYGHRGHVEEEGEGFLNKKPLR